MRIDFSQLANIDQFSSNLIIIVCCMLNADITFMLLAIIIIIVNYTLSSVYNRIYIKLN